MSYTICCGCFSNQRRVCFVFCVAYSVCYRDSKDISFTVRTFEAVPCMTNNLESKAVYSCISTFAVPTHCVYQELRNPGNKLCSVVCTHWSGWSTHFSGCTIRGISHVDTYFWLHYSWLHYKGYFTCRWSITVIRSEHSQSYRTEYSQSIMTKGQTLLYTRIISSLGYSKLLQALQTSFPSPQELKLDVHVPQ